MIHKHISREYVPCTVYNLDLFKHVTNLSGIFSSFFLEYMCKVCVGNGKFMLNSWSMSIMYLCDLNICFNCLIFILNYFLNLIVFYLKYFTLYWFCILYSNKPKIWMSLGVVQLINHRMIIIRRLLLRLSYKVTTEYQRALTNNKHSLHSMKELHLHNLRH